MSKLSEKWDRIEDNPLIMVSELKELWAKETSDFMQDDSLDDVLNIVIRILNGEVPEPSKVAFVCVKLEAYALKYRTRYTSYMGFLKGTDDANMKKNMYKELYTGIDRLVDALKYLMR